MTEGACPGKGPPGQKGEAGGVRHGPEAPFPGPRASAHEHFAPRWHRERRSSGSPTRRDRSWPGWRTLMDRMGDRREKVRRNLASSEADAFLIGTATNVRYLTGF